MGQPIRLKFAKRLRELRRKRGLTQQELAELAGLRGVRAHRGLAAGRLLPVAQAARQRLADLRGR